MNGRISHEPFFRFSFSEIHEYGLYSDEEGIQHYIFRDFAWVLFKLQMKWQIGDLLGERSEQLSTKTDSEGYVRTTDLYLFKFYETFFPII